MHAHTHAHTHARTHAHTHTHTRYTHTHIHTCTHTQSDIGFGKLQTYTKLEKLGEVSKLSFTFYTIPKYL